jgi:hypothetical protein
MKDGDKEYSYNRELIIDEVRRNTAEMLENIRTYYVTIRSMCEECEINMIRGRKLSIGKYYDFIEELDIEFSNLQVNFGLLCLSNIEGVLIPDNSKGLLVEAVVLAIPSGLCMGFDVGNTVIIYKQKGLPYKGKLFIDHSDVVASLGD